MTRPAALTAKQVDEFVATSPDWTREAGQLVRRVTADAFLEAIRWVVEVADAAEAADHHPDIDIRWRTVTFRLSTHDAAAITSLDLALAREIDRIVGFAS